MKKKYKLICLVGIILICLVAAGIYLTQPKTIPTQGAVQGVLSETLTEQGYLEPERGIVVTAAATGIVSRIAVDAGRSIGQGDILLEIDTSVMERELERQIAGLKLQQSALYSGNNSTLSENLLRQEQLQQQLRTAQQEHDRLFGDDGTARALISIARNSYSQARRAYRYAKDYYGDDFEEDYSPEESELLSIQSQMNIAQQNLIIAQNNGSKSTRAYYEDMIASCEAQLNALSNQDAYANNGTYAAAQQLQLTMDILTEKMGKGTVTAPYGGTVWELLVEEGEFVAENQPIAKLYPQTGMRIAVSLLAEDALTLQTGDTAQCALADGTTFTAQVQFISPIATETVSAIGLTENRCRVELVSSHIPSHVGAGHQVDIAFTFLAANDVLSVPANSLVPMDSGSGVFVLRDGKALLIPVETGIRSGGRVEILSGLSAGEPVVPNPYDSGVKNGDRVVPQA